MDRRGLIVRSAGLAGAGLVLGALPVAEIVQAASPGSIDVGTHQATVRKITVSAAHAALAKELEHAGAHFGAEGGLVIADNAILRSVVTSDGRRGLAHIQLHGDGASTAAALVQDGAGRQLFGVQHGRGLPVTTLRRDSGSSPLFVPPGYLELPAGAAIVNKMPSLTPPVGAQTLNCWGCVLQGAYICWEVPALVCNVNAVCQVIVALACGVVSFWACGQIAC